MQFFAVVNLGENFYEIFYLYIKFSSFQFVFG